MVDTGIAVVGRGEVKGAPDTATIQIGVSVTRPSVAEATRDAASSARAMIEALVAGGVAQNDVQTSNLSVNPNYEYPPNRQPTLTGYTFTNTVSAALREIDSAGDVIDAALRAGGDDAVLQGLTFSLHDDADAVRQARAAAFGDARDKAEQLAALAGVRLGAAVTIEEVVGGPPYPMPAPKMMRAADAGGPPIAAGQVTTSILVSVRFVID
jgi:uncharacterized protein